MATNEAEVLATCKRLLERAAEDPEFEDELARDPWGAAEQAEGLTRRDIIVGLQLRPEASDDEAAEALKERVSRTEWAADFGDLPDSIP